jgi:hypothetical protein
MSLTLGAWLAAGMGALTAYVDRRLRAVESRVPVWLIMAGGSIVAALGYGAFVLAGAVLSVMMFSSGPDGWPALIGVLLGCAMYLLSRLLEAFFRDHFGMRTRPTLAPRSFDARAGAPRPARDREPARGDPFRSRSLPVPDRSFASRLDRARSFDDFLEAEPRGGAATMWFGGVALALLPLAYGLRCIVTLTGDVGATIFGSTVSGAAAVALGVGWIGVALFLHFHFFFGLHPALKAHSRRGKVIAVFMAGLGLVIAAGWPLFDRYLP